jgi:hypothetical protein
VSCPIPGSRFLHRVTVCGWHASRVCSIYHIREDMLGNPYGAVQVAWLQQEKGTNQWVYTYTQTDSGMQLLGLYGVPSSGSCVGSALCS